MVVLASGLAALGLAACGASAGGAGDAATLIKQTFSGSHTVNSGNLNFNLTVHPTGSTTLTRPISVGFGGPFQTLGKGKLPASNFNVTLTGQGKTGAVGILSTGTAGYVTLKGTGYQLPAATFKQLESSFLQVAPSGGAPGTGVFSKLGIDPMRWLRNPSVLGHESVGGTGTTHLRAGVDVNAFLGDFNTFLKRASSVGVSGSNTLSGGLPAATRQQLAGIQNPTFDVWTGDGDRTLRRLTLNLTLPVTGQISSLLGGMKMAQINLDMQYTNLNQPQIITAPSSVHPYSEFQAKLKTFLASVQGSSGITSSAAGSGLGSTVPPSTSAPAPAAPSAVAPSPAAPSSPAGASSQVQAYSQCLAAAGTDITKLQACASLLK